MSNLDALHARAKALKLHGLLAHWTELADAGWLEALIDWEEQERGRRSLERRLGSAHIGRFKPACDFDWTWPKRCDRAAFEALMALDFLKDATNVIVVGPNGVGKSTLARNIAHHALIHGHTVLFTSAGQLLGELAALDSDSTLRRRLRHYAGPDLLAIDEVGYLSYSNRHADLLFELVSRRYERKSTLITTNRPFAERRESVRNSRPTIVCRRIPAKVVGALLLSRSGCGMIGLGRGLAIGGVPAASRHRGSPCSFESRYDRDRHAWTTIAVKVCCPATVTAANVVAAASFDATAMQLPW